MPPRPSGPDTAAASRDSPLTLRRVERHQRLVELLGGAPDPVPSAVLARELGIGVRTVERDLARLREAGVPIETLLGTHGGSLLPRAARPAPVRLGFAEIAALIASLTALGPTATDSSASGMQALLSAIDPSGRPQRSASGQSGNAITEGTADWR